MRLMIVVLSVIVLGSLAQASNVMDEDTENHIKADIELIHSFDQYQSPRFGSFLIVGADPDPNWCDFSSIQAAINSAAQSGITEIRIAGNKTYNENLVIDDISISLISGYSSCQSAGTPLSRPNTTQAVVDGGGISSVVKITGESQKNTIILRNLRLINGQGPTLDSSTAGGGILSHNADVRVSLVNVDVRSNDASAGAGIYISGGDTDMSLQESRVMSNSGSHGAGIYCNGEAGASVVLSENSGIVANVAQSSGGGVYLRSCYFALYSGSASGGQVGISSNWAFGNGGGIYATNNATVIINGHKNCNSTHCIGDDANPANVSGNIAGFLQQSFGSGGGIYAFASSVSIYAGLFEGNSSKAHGGAIYIFGTRFVGEASLTIGRLHEACWNNQRCNYFVGNESETGGAISNVTDNTDISYSYFENNMGVTGAAIRSLGSDMDILRVEGSVFNNNGDNSTESTIYALGAIDHEYIHSTIADNTIADNIFGAAVFRFERNAEGAPGLEIHSSIIDNPGAEILSHNMLNYRVDISCIIANEIQSISAGNNLINDAEGVAGGAFISQVNPFFVDRNNKDYHLLSGSPAIDYCNTPARTTVRHNDMDYEERGQDDPTHPDTSIFSFFDIGADEFYPADPDCSGDNVLIDYDFPQQTPILCEATESINTQGPVNIMTGADVTFRAGVGVMLEGGFAVQPTAVFKASVIPSL